MKPFSIARLPKIVFGAGTSAELPGIVRGLGERALVVTRPGFGDTPEWRRIAGGFAAAGVLVVTETVSGEPSPGLVDEIVVRARGAGAARPDVVVGIGGGSVLDTAKAVAGLIVPGNSVADHLEGVGPGLPYRGPALPFVAVPTTAGTGSEATKNAVISRRGPNGYKKSFRDERLVAQVAVVDPDLLASAPQELIAANGMDALTQLLESYTSSKANEFTDALALSGLAAVRDGLLAWFDDPSGSGAAAARERMAYAALLSGICLAQAGLGAVHGLASPLGAQSRTARPAARSSRPRLASTSKRCRPVSRTTLRWRGMRSSAGCSPNRRKRRSNRRTRKLARRWSSGWTRGAGTWTCPVCRPSASETRRSPHSSPTPAGRA